MSEQIISGIVLALLGILGGWVTATIQGRGNPTTNLTAIIAELRAQNAILIKDKILLSEDLKLADKERREEMMRFSAAMGWAQDLYHIARRYKPAELELPEYEPPNGITPPEKL